MLYLFWKYEFRSQFLTMRMILILIIITMFKTIITNSKCTADSPTITPNYYLMEKCHRSKLAIAARANYSSISSCQKLAVEKKGLALNYSPPEAWSGSNETVLFTCEILKCAEAYGGLSLMNDTRYDYYSLYAKPLPHINSSCVPASGMFYLITKRLNYTSGALECQNMTAIPADIISEQRTDALAQLLAGSTVDAAFVGLRSINGSALISTNGDSLDCTTYRAWAPGHPRKSRVKFDCVLITRHRTWRTASCKKNYPILCELIPGGPYKRRSIFISTKPQVNETVVEKKDEKNSKKDKA